MIRFLTAVFSVLVIATAACAQWVKQDVRTTASFRGLSVVDRNVVWASGTGGTVIRTVDGGKTWNVMSVAGAENLDFRDIEAFDAKTAYALSIGNGEDSRIYKTTDGGASWKLQFKNTNAKAFFDALACWSRTECIAMSDPVDGHYLLISTRDGDHWNPILSNRLPAAWDGEAAFAASGTCLIAVRPGLAFLVSGGADARVFRSEDKGQTWSAVTTPIVRGTSGSGIFSIAMRDGKRGFIVGGDYEKPTLTGTATLPASNDTPRGYIAAETGDGGITWKPVVGLTGYRSGAAFIDARTLVAVGTNGTDVSTDGGRTWRRVGTEDLNAVASKGAKSTWAVGAKGMVVKWNGGK